MTREEAIGYIKRADTKVGKTIKTRTAEAIEMAIEALEQETKTWQFAEWVAGEIFDNNWEYNKDAFAELACRKLVKLGIVRVKGDEWELVEPQESEE